LRILNWHEVLATTTGSDDEPPPARMTPDEAALAAEA
jgi:hypothetical protein